MRRILFLAVIPSLAFVLFGCICRESPKDRVELQPISSPPGTEGEPHPALRVDDALPPDGYAPGWKATPGSYIYSASEDELWKIYDGSAPGIIAQGGREAVTQGYENREAGADKSFRVFILRFVDQAHALAFLKKELEGATGGENLAACLSARSTTGASRPARASAAPPGTGAAGPATGRIAAGQIFDKGKAPWARFVIGHFLVSINWEGSTDDADDSTLSAIRTVASKLGAR
jgi:hypothetical protein